MTWKVVAVVGVVVAGAVSMFAVYAFSRPNKEVPRASSVRSGPSSRKGKGRLQVYTSPYGSAAVFDPVTRTQCEVSGEGGVPNLFCTHRSPRHRYQVVFWDDEVQVFDLAAPGEPMAPQFSVPSRLRPGQKYAAR